MSKGGTPHMYDTSLWQQAGVDPRTGKQLREYAPADKEAIKRQLRVLDEQDAVNRYTWYNLPNNITSQELERMLYYRGQLAFFYFKETDEFWFMPFTLSSNDNMALDFYGRYKYIKPIPFYEGTSDSEKKNFAKLRTLLSTKNLKVAYGQHLQALTYDDVTTTAVILRDYTNQYSQTILPRKELNDNLLSLEATMFPYMRTALKNSTGVQGMRVGNEDEASNVYAFNKTYDCAALEGDAKVPIIGQLDFQDLSGGNVANAEEFLMAMQSIDNYRLSLYGIDNGGIFQKKAHELQAEQVMNMGIANIPLQDGLTQRQNFCLIANSYFPLMMWCEISESIVGVDRDLDGEATETEEDSSVGYDNTSTQEDTSNE